MRRALRDDELQKQFERDGYILVESFLSPREIEDLIQYYDSEESDLKEGFHATMHSHMVDLRRRVNEKISSVFKKHAEKYLLDYRPLLANYTVKEPDEGSFFDFHLDWTMTNERRYISITIWCPLEDVNPVNGNLWVLKGSHQFDYTARGEPGMYTYTEHQWPERIDQKYEKVALALKAGTAVIYDHRLFHGSPANRSGKRRLAINQALIPDETMSWHYYRHEDNRIEIFEVDDDFYNRHIVGTFPEGKSLGWIDINPNFLTQDQINTLYVEPEPEKVQS